MNWTIVIGPIRDTLRFAFIGTFLANRYDFGDDESPNYIAIHPFRGCFS